MKKRLLSMLMAMCLMATMVPAAFAADEENGRPTPEIITVSEEDIVSTPMLLAELEGDGSQESPYLIEDEFDFQHLMDIFSSYRGETYVKLEADIDISSITSSMDDWSGCWKYFRGEFDGQNHTISGIPENCYLIYGWVGGTIKDLTLDLKGQAGTLVYYPVRLSSGGTTTYLPTTLSGIKVISDKEITLKDNSQANYAPFLFASGPYFTMENCVNYADISGNTYASVFYGYYPMANPLPADHCIKFVNCANHGDITYQYAGLLFGNPTGLFYKNIVFEGIKNYGELRGTESVYFFSSDANSPDAIPSYNTPGSFMYEQEAKLPEAEVNGTCEDTNCPKHGLPEHSGSKCLGGELNDFSVSVQGDEFVVDLSDNSSVDYYVASAFCYVSVFSVEDGEFISNGTDRMILNQKFTATGESFTITDFKNYPVKDGAMPEGEQWDETSVDGLYVLSDSDNSCYWLDNSVVHPGNYVWYLDGERNPDTINWEFYVSAFDSDGHLLDTAVLK